MKTAVFALLFSSVLAQPQQGTEAWDRTMKDHIEGLNRMADNGFNMIVNLDPQGCTKSHECGLPYRQGGCCFRVQLADGETKDYQNEIIKMQGENGGLCYIGSGVDVIEANSGSVDAYTYSEYMWDNDAQIRATWGAYTGGEIPESFEAFNEWLKINYPDQIARRDMQVTGQCIDVKLHPYDQQLLCNSSADCADAWGHFNGGCCSRIEMTKGQEFATGNTKQMFEEQGTGGYCSTNAQTNYVEQNGGEFNVMDFNRWSFENDMIARLGWLGDYPDEMKEDMQFDQVLDDVRRVYPEIDNDNSMWISAKCIDERLAGEPMDWEAAIEKYMGGDDDMWAVDGVDFVMEDNFMGVYMDGMSIEMEESDDGKSMRIMMGATKVGASLLALAASAMTLY